MYPNPGNKSVNVEIKNDNGNIRMMTIHGNIVLDRRLSSGTNKISTESLADGIYIYRISDGNTTVTGKWIKKNTNE
ncbi:MAG: T9SS type A sorting domain-containing protein [Bacteroidales bacterium]|nr:T9SS type A sorting domain-containing protein [Bacteroidales bacterium]